MIEVSIEVGNGANSFRVAVRAESIRGAMAATNAYYPGRQTKLLLPIDSEAFFVKDGAAVDAATGSLEFEMPTRLAG